MRQKNEMRLRTPRPVGEQYHRLKAFGASPESWGIKRYGDLYGVVIAGQIEYLEPSRKVAWRDSRYGWSKYDAHKRGKQGK